MQNKLIDRMIDDRSYQESDLKIQQPVTNQQSPRYYEDPDAHLRQEFAQKLNLEEVKKKLKEVFIYYASYGDRLNTQNLKSAKFHKMLQDAGIMRESNRPMSPGGSGSLMNKKRIDLIFCSVNKHKVNMSFDIFLQALIKIAEFKYNERSSDAL